MELSDAEFRRILEGAVAGKHGDLETLLKLYEPLIRKYSRINWILDEDLLQYQLIHIALNISKFLL